jgi:hypothetical protein
MALFSTHKHQSNITGVISMGCLILFMLKLDMIDLLNFDMLVAFWEQSKQKLHLLTCG